MPLIAHFKLNGDTIDTVGTYSSNTPTAITYTNLGKLDGAAIFNGSSSAILLGSTINLAGNANWTVSVWVKTTSTARMSILSNSSGGPVQNDICIEGGKIAYYHYNAAWLFKQGTIPINDGNWHHLAWVNFVGNKMNMYVDGVLDQSMVDSTQSTGPVNQIGKNWSTAYFNGTMDDFRIYNDASLDKITDLSFTKKLVVHWPLIGSTNDYSGNLLNGTASGAVTSAFGKIGSCYYFDGVDDYIYRTTESRINIADEITVCAWVKFITITAGGSFNGGIIASKGFWSTAGWHLGIDWETLHFSTAESGGNSVASYATSNFALGVWYHIVGRAKADGTLQIFVNGTSVVTSAQTKRNMMSSYDLYVGKGYSNKFNGYINDFRLYNYALSDYEIQELAKAKILHYTFDDPYEEPTINICYDLALNYYDKSRFYSTDGDGFSEVLIGNKKWLQYNSGSRRLASLPISANTTYTWSLKIISPVDSSISFTEWDGGAYGTQSYSITEGYNEVSHTFTSRVSSTNEILHLGSFPVGSKLADFQLEAKDHSTPITNGTRNIGVNDISGYKKHGAISAITDSPRWVNDSKVGSGSVYFNGTTPHIISGLSTFGGLTTVTISFWRKNDTTITSWLPFVGQTGSQYIMATSSGTGGFYHASIGSSWEIFKDGVAQGPLVAATPFTDQLWHHYAIRGVNLSSWTQFRINGYTGEWNNEGYFDDIRIYNTNLSDSDILALYNRKANLDNLGNTQANQFNERDNLLEITNTQIETQAFGNGLFSYTQSNCQVTLTTRGYRIYRPANLIYPDAGNTMWGGLRIVMDSIPNGKGILQKGRSYRLRFKLNGQSTNVFVSLGFTNNMGWGGGGLNPSPTVITSHTNIPSGFNGETELIYEFTINDDVYKVCTTSYSSFVAGNTYLSYKDLQLGFTYQSTGTLGTDIYITDIELFDITDYKGIAFVESGIGFFDNIDEVSGTPNPAAQHEITNTGTLIINGEFSEVD